MPLPKPSLDNRRFDQLVGEGRALIPRLAPRWTDQNASDPGITLLELGAWLAEQNIYRFDRVSDEALRAFVRLVGIEPAMPTVAHTVVSIGNGNAAGIALPPRVQLGAGGTALFETTDAAFVSPAQLVSVMARAAAPTDVTTANSALTPFYPYGARPRPGYALYLGFDQPLDAAAATLALYVWNDHWPSDAATRAALRAEQAALSAHASGRCAPPDWRLHYRVSTVWEFYAGGNLWRPLADVQDATRALTLSGFVRFSAPVGHQAGGPGPQYFIRCRTVRGRFECAPRLVHVGFNAVACEHALSIDEQSIGQARGHAQAVFELAVAPVVSGSVRLRLDNGAGDVQTDWAEVPDFERAGPFDRVFALTPESGQIQSGDGLRAAILPAGYAVYAAYRTGGDVAGNVAAQTLTTVPSTAHNLALVPTLGTLVTPLSVLQVFAADGGAPRETLSAAQARAFAAVCAVDKAVTLEDFERLALATPGVPVARVSAVSNLNPDLPCYPAPGVVTLIVIPPCPKPAPLPSRALLDAVERYLEPRRLVTSEIHAIAPSYRRVGINATLHLECDADAQKVVASATARINAFFDPLTGGRDQAGWPFGRTVYRTEMMELLANLPGVSRVTALSLQSGCPAGGCAAAGSGCASTCGCAGAGAGPSSTCGCGAGNANPGAAGGCCGASPDGGRCDNIELCPHELVVPGSHRLQTVSDVARNLTRSDARECPSA